jgi:rubrerythrin
MHDPEPLEVSDEPEGTDPGPQDTDDDPYSCYRCPECGYEGLEHDQFCEKCGTPLNTFGYLRYLALLEQARERSAA